MCARRRPACSKRRWRRASRRTRRFARRARKCDPQHSSSKTTAAAAAPVRRQLHKVSAVEAASVAQSHARRTAAAVVQMCEAPSAGSRRLARHIVDGASAHLLANESECGARRSGPATTQARLRNSTKRSLAEIVAQMQREQQQQHSGVCAQKTIAAAQMEQRRPRKPPMGAAIGSGPDIENIRSQASRCLLARSNRNGKIINKFGKLIIRNRTAKYSQGTSIIDRSSSSIGPQSRSLDNSVRFLHERQLNRQRPSVQRLGPSPPLADQPVQSQLMTTTAGSRDVDRNVALGQHRVPSAKRRLTVTRLVVRPAVRSSTSTQTTRILASGQSQASRSVPYNTRQRAAAASSSMIVSSHQRHQISQPQPALATMAICERLGSITLQTQAAAAAATTTRQVDALDKIKASTYPRWWPWSKWDKSHECQVAGDQLSLCFHPDSSESTAACRAVEPLRRSGQQYYWEVHVEEKCYGTSVMFGLCTRQQRLHVNDYCQLLGEDGHGWSVSHKGLAAHNGQKVQFTEEFAQFQPHTIGLHYDTARGELSYFLDGKSLGVAFRGLNDIEDELYPAVASTAKCTRMRLVSARCSHMSLLDRSRYALIKSFARDRRALNNYLRGEGAPTHLLEYVNKLTRVKDCPVEEEDQELAPPTTGARQQEEGGPAARTRSSGLHNKPAECSSSNRRSVQRKGGRQATSSGRPHHGNKRETRTRTE